MVGVRMKREGSMGKMMQGKGWRRDGEGGNEEGLVQEGLGKG